MRTNKMLGFRRFHMPYTCPTWAHGATPHTDSNAVASSSSMVSRVTVIEVKDATYRNSRPFSGVFEMVNPNRDPRNWRGLRVEVYCSWHGVRPPMTWPNIKVDPNNYKIVTNYSGSVIRDIS